MRKKLYSNVLKVLLLAIFYGYVGVSIFYSHIHVVHGDIISHLHLFERTAEQQQQQPFHSHTQEEIQLFNSLSFQNTGSDIIPHFVFCTPSIFSVKNTILPICKGYVNILEADFSRRGPPSLS